VTARGAYVHTVASMGTVVTIHVVGHEADRAEQDERKRSVESALAWFHDIERVCSRFDPRSEVAQLSAHVGARVRVSDMLFEAVRFALAVAEESDGAFDPTVGLLLEAAGFNREYRTGAVARTALEPDAAASYRDVHLDVDERTIMLARPLLLDLGAVAKGLAIDMAARELRATSFDDFAIDAGGDLYLAGCNADGKPWSVGVRHPRDESALYETLLVSNAAVCTSGDYERRIARDGGPDKHHIIDPRTRVSASVAASVTVLAPSAMVADALSTAAFVLGPADGLALLERHGVDGLVITPELERFATAGMSAHSHIDARSSPDFARDR
jgi:thiamine biosynthesis lipoprotein